MGIEGISKFGNFTELCLNIYAHVGVVCADRYERTVATGRDSVAK